MTDYAFAPGTLRVRTASGSDLPTDPPLIVDANVADRLEVAGPGRAVLVTVAGSHGPAPGRTPLLVAARRRRDPFGPRLVEVVVDGWRFELEVEPAARAAVRERASRARAAQTHGVGAEVRAIIPGRVVAISVAAGDPVSAGQQLLVVEAMKMQNEVRTPLAGVVESVAVAEGQTIEPGDLLVIVGAGG